MGVCFRCKRTGAKVCDGSCGLCSDCPGEKIREGVSDVEVD